MSCYYAKMLVVPCSYASGSYYFVLLCITSCEFYAVVQADRVGTVLLSNTFSEFSAVTQEDRIMPLSLYISLNGALLLM